MKGARRLWPLWLLVASSALVRADDTTSPAKKPAVAPSAPASKPAAATPKPAAHEADEEFLEFLGSVGEESDGEWIDYLSKTDISKAAKKDKASTK